PDVGQLAQVPAGRLTSYAVFTARMASPDRLAVRVPSYSYVMHSYQETRGDQTHVRSYYQPVMKETVREYRVGDFEMFRADGRLVATKSLPKLLAEDTRVVIATGRGIHPADYAVFRGDTLVLVFPTPESTPAVRFEPMAPVPV